MTLRGKGINVQVLTECICYLLFGFLLFHLTYSGRYLNYVTPRMKPYLYGMAAFMGGDEWKIPADTAVPGKTGAFLCVYHSDSAACPAAGRAGRGKYGQKL